MAFPTGNLFARYEARLQTGVPNLTQLDTIPDQSGNGYNLFQASTRGTYNANVINGEPAYYLGGSGYYQISSTDNAAISSADPQVTIAAIINSNNAGGSRTWPFGTTQDESTSIFAFTDGASNGKWGTFLRGASNLGQAYITAVDDTVWSVLTLVYDGSTIKTYVNGTEVASTSASGNQVMNRIRLGSIVNQNYEGFIAGAYIWKTGLDATQRAGFHSYVQDTYGITVSDYVPSATVETFYVDGHLGITDTGNNYSNDSWAFNGDQYSYASTVVDGAVLIGKGTTAVAVPNTTIVQVEAQHKGGNGSTGTPHPNNVDYTNDSSEDLGQTIAYGDGISGYTESGWEYLNEPTGGWTWTKIKNLIVHIYTPDVITDDVGFGPGSSETGFIQIRVTYTVNDSASGQIKVYTSELDFEPKPIKYWDGSDWQVKTLKQWDGSDWVVTNY